MDAKSEAKALSRLLGLDDTASYGSSSSQADGHATKAVKASKKPTAVKRNARVADSGKNGDNGLPPKEQHALATDTVNLTLKVLTEAVKSGTRVTSDKHERTPEDEKVRKQPPKRAGLPLREISNPPSKTHTSRTTSSLTNGATDDGASAGLVAIAECARIAFSWLRAAPRQYPTVKTLPSSQLEQGMLALASKLTAVGLSSYALKELRTLKRRFEVSKTATSKDTLANLLRVELEDDSPDRISALVTYHSNVLKILLHSGSASTIEEAVGYIDPSDPCSPSETILRSIQGQSDNSKAAKQLEILAQSVISLSVEADRSRNVNVYCGFRLRVFALIIRQKWWQLAKHDPDLARELFVPFAQGLESCMRQSSMAREQQYATVKDLFSRCLSTYVGSEIPRATRVSLDKILQNLSIMADDAGLPEDSASWLESLSYSSGTDKGIAEAVSNIRALRRDLGRSHCSGKSGVDTEALYLEKCLRGINPSTDPEVMLILSELTGLRKAILSILNKKPDSSEDGRATQETMTLCAMAFAMLRFVRQKVVLKVKPMRERKTPASATEEDPLIKPIRQIVELATFACKTGLSTQIPLISVKDALDDSVLSLPLITTESDPSLYIYVSNLYWLLLQKITDLPEQGEGIESLVLAKAAVEVLAGLSEAEQRSAFLWTKLERLCRMLLEAHSYRDAYKQCSRAIALQIKAGITKDISRAFETTTNIVALAESQAAESLQRLFILHHRAALKVTQKRTYYLNQDLEALEKAALLELQLPLLVTSLIKHSQNEQVIADLDTLLNSLFNIYESSKCNVRRARLARLVLLLSLSNSNSVRPAIVLIAQDTELNTDDLGNDDGLSDVTRHTDHALKLAQSMHANHENSCVWDNALSFWEGLEDDSGTFHTSMKGIDDILELLELLNTAASFFAMRGLDQYQYRTLKLACSLQTSRPTVESSEVLRIRCDIVSLCIKMGRFQEAHQLYDAVKASIKTFTPSLADRTRLHLARMELSVGKGDMDAAYAAFLTFNKLGTDLGQPKTDRLALYRSQAEAGCLISEVFREKGFHVQSLHYAKEALRLYRSLIGSLELVGNNQKHKLETSDAGVSALVQTFESLVIAPKKETAEQPASPVAIKASMWQFGPGLFRALALISDLYAYEGMRPEAEYYAQQAGKFATSLQSCGLHLQLHTLQLRHAYTAGSSRPETTDELREYLLGVEGAAASLDLIRYHIAEGDLLAKFGDMSSAVAEYDQAEAILQKLNELITVVTPSACGPLPRGKTTARKEAAVPVRKPIKASTTKTVRKAKATNGAQPTAKTCTAPGASPTSDVMQATVSATTHISTIRSEITRQRDLALLLGGTPPAFSGLDLDSVNARPPEDLVKSKILSTRLTLAQVAGQITTDVTYNALPESTLALPALYSQNQSNDPNGSLSTKIVSSPQTVNAYYSREPTRSGRRQTKVVDLGVLLLEARAVITPSLPQAVTSRSLASAYQVGGLSASITFLLSAISTIEVPADFIHPVRLVHSHELPAVEALQRQIDAVAVDKQQQSLQELLSSHEVIQDVNSATSAAKFQRDYIDILPSSWTAISIGMSEDCSEIWLARYQSGNSPFILRLPMARHKANDLDDETTFDFEAGRAELRDIIECSDYSCHHAPDTSSKDAKTAWWTEREALDERLKELLVNMENIWLGGFKGILSQHTRQASLLARFRKSFDIILDRHLPSRQGSRSRSKNLVIDSHILKLFIGLGGDNEGEDDMEEHVLDLLYFVVDLLQFNGEPNAYDEVDFDSMTIETVEAMRAYHDADNLVESTDKHMILVLDKRLHAFPWESMPCLQGASVSRVGNMLHLRERVLALRRQQAERDDVIPNEKYSVSRTPGTFIVNPSGDLKRTQETLSPYLDHLTRSSSWTSMTNHAPSEKEFSQALSTSSTLLYFGHGSGNQYIRNRSIRKLDKCAEVVWLMGCSSGTVTENGDFEPVSVPLSYLVAGESPPLAHLFKKQPAPSPETEQEARAVPKTPSPKLMHDTAADTDASRGRKGLCMSVLATLWDVTDKDIDRFSIRVGEQWGLFSSPSASFSNLASSTSASRSRSKTTSAAAAEAPKTPGPKRGRSDTGKTPAKGKTPGRGKVEEVVETKAEKKMSLVEAVAKSRDACYLRYLNGAAAVVYGVPVYLGD
ncbi:hypothetical protein MBLNU457_3549t2 [Dothideomycetes sp. NU457]